MTSYDFNVLKQAASALPPDQMRQLRDELERKLATLPATAPVGAGEEPVITRNEVTDWRRQPEQQAHPLAEAMEEEPD